MTPQEIIAEVYGESQSQIPSAIVSALKFNAAEESFKFDVHNTGGRILGKQTGKVWAGRWCFYSVTIGPDHNNMRRIGGVGFGCAVNQKPCGSGQHETALLEIAARFCKAHPQFHHSPRGNSWMSIATPYYPSGGGSFPIKQAAKDLAALISETFNTIDALIV